MSPQGRRGAQHPACSSAALGGSKPSRAHTTDRPPRAPARASLLTAGAGAPCVYRGCVGGWGWVSWQARGGIASVDVDNRSSPVCDQQTAGFHLPEPSGTRPASTLETQPAGRGRPTQKVPRHPGARGHAWGRTHIWGRSPSNVALCCRRPGRRAFDSARRGRPARRLTEPSRWLGSKPAKAAAACLGCTRRPVDLHKDRLTYPDPLDPSINAKPRTGVLRCGGRCSPVAVVGYAASAKHPSIEQQQGAAASRRQGL